MKPLKLMNYAAGQWTPGEDAAAIASAVTGETVAETGSKGIDFAAMAAHARKTGGPALRAMTFQYCMSRLDFVPPRDVTQLYRGKPSD